MSRNLFKENIRLAWDLAHRDLSAKYRRSALEWLWLVLPPVCLLAIYSVLSGKCVSWRYWIALWGQEHHIEIVLFKPPVRSDLYRFQLLSFCY